MLPHARRARAGREIPTSSLADVAFLLLMFFLVTTVFEEERGLRIVLPDSEPVAVPEGNVLHLVVRPDGLVGVRGGESAFTRTVDAAVLPGIWREAAADNPLLIAAVRTHPEAPYGRMIDVLDALQTAGAERISLHQAEDDPQRP
jgi:biopolymer transport protein ExbD